MSRSAGRGEGTPQGLRPGLQSSAPDGAAKRRPHEEDFVSELLTQDISVLAKGKTGTKLPEIGQWLAEIGHNPFPSSGIQRTPALTRTKNR